MSSHSPAQYVSGHSASVLRGHAQRDASNSCGYLLPHLDRLYAVRPDFSLLDIGCGPGSITIDLARRYPSATILGVEYDAAGGVLDRARQDAETAGVSNVQFAVMDIHTLETTNQGRRWDVVHAHQVLQHCGKPIHALQQMRAITKPGGLVAVRTADLSAVTTYPPEQPGWRTWQRLWLAVGPAQGAEMRAGALQHVWARAAGFDMSMPECCHVGFGVMQWFAREDRQAHAAIVAERVLDDPWKANVLQAGLASVEELEEMARSIREWGEAEEGALGIMNGEMVVSV